MSHDIDTLSSAEINSFPEAHDRPDTFLVERMLSNFLGRKSAKIGRLPASGAGTDLDVLAGKIPEAPGVYVIFDGEFYKIGLTKNFAARIASLRTGNPHKITVISFIETVNRLQGERLENALHRTFDLKRANGEWFDLSPEDVEFIKEYQLSTDQKPIMSLNIEQFSAKKKELAIKMIVTASKSLGKRTMTIEDLMKNATNSGFTFAGWKNMLYDLNREKIIYFAGNLIRVPRDLIA